MTKTEKDIVRNFKDIIEKYRVYDVNLNTGESVLGTLEEEVYKAFKNYKLIIEEAVLNGKASPKDLLDYVKFTTEFLIGKAPQQVSMDVDVKSDETPALKKMIDILINKKSDENEENVDE